MIQDRILAVLHLLCMFTNVVLVLSNRTEILSLLMLLPSFIVSRIIAVTISPQQNAL